MLKWVVTMTEAQVQSRFTKAVKGGALAGLGSCAFELKVAGRSGRVAYSQLAEHQLLALVQAGSEVGLVHKISDSAIGYKPCDGVYLVRASGYLGIAVGDGYVYMVEVSRIMGRVYDASGKRRRGSLTADWIKQNSHMAVAI